MAEPLALLHLESYSLMFGSIVNSSPDNVLDTPSFPEKIREWMISTVQRNLGDIKIMICTSHTQCLTGVEIPKWRGQPKALRSGTFKTAVESGFSNGRLEDVQEVLTMFCWLIDL